MKPEKDLQKERKDLEDTLVMLFIVGCVLVGFIVFGEEREQGQATGLFFATLFAFMYGASLLNVKGGER